VEGHSLRVQSVVVNAEWRLLAQPCDAGISICPHWFFIVRQQARSSLFICASGTMQAIAGARHVTTSKTNTPTWRKYVTPPS
jgi:hypothetical protein